MYLSQKKKMYTWYEKVMAWDHKKSTNFGYMMGSFSFIPLPLISQTNLSQQN